jgi:hypothetical protein
VVSWYRRWVVARRGVHAEFGSELDDVLLRDGDINGAIGVVPIEGY